MIPPVVVPWLEALKPFWPLIWRALVVALLVGTGWVSGHRNASRECEAEKASAAAATVDAVNELNARVDERDAKLNEMETEHASEMEALLARQRATPPRVVRVCADARGGPMPGVSARPGQHADNGTRGGELPIGTGYDIGPGLKQLADRADRLRVKCIAQQARSDTLASERP